MKNIIPDLSPKFWFKLLVLFTLIFIIEWLGIGDFVHELGKELGKWIKSLF